MRAEGGDRAKQIWHRVGIAPENEALRTVRVVRGALAPAIADVLACTRIHLGIAGAPTIQGYSMKIVVIGGTGLIGSKTVAMLRQGGHEVVAASPKSGVNSSQARASRKPWRARRS